MSHPNSPEMHRLLPEESGVTWPTAPSGVSGDRSPEQVGTQDSYLPRNAAPDPIKQSPLRRPKDPMSLSSIVSEDAKPNGDSSLHSALKSSKQTNDTPLSDKQVSSRPASAMHSPVSTRISEVPSQHGPMTNGVKRSASRDHPTSRSTSTKSHGKFPAFEKTKNHSRHSSLQNTALTKSQPEISERHFQAALAKIEKTEESDVESPGFERQRELYDQRRLKRRREIDEKESEMRKVFTIAFCRAVFIFTNRF